MSKEQEMRALFDKWRASGTPRARFAREHRIPVNSFHYWCQRFEGKRPKPAERRGQQAIVSTTPAFVEITDRSTGVPVPTAVRPAPRLRFDLPDGTSITVY